MKQEALIDNSVLVNLFSIDSLDILYSIFSRIYIPTEIKNEFEKIPSNERLIFSNKITTDYGFFRLCDTFDPIVLSFISRYKTIQKGESEAISQSLKRSISLFLTDDAACIKTINTHFSNIRCYNTLTVIALADISGFIIDQPAIIKKLHKIHSFHSNDLRISYQIAIKELRIHMNKKILSRKTSLKYILN